MKRRSPQQRRRRLAALSGLGLMMALAGLLIVLDLPDTTTDGLAGTMMNSSSSAFTFRSGALASSLDDPLTVSFRDVPDSITSGGESWKLVASRDESLEVICLLRDWDAENEMPGDEFLIIPRSVECLDAGPWRVYVVGEKAPAHKLPGLLTIQNGSSFIELTDMLSAVGHEGVINFELAVHRPASSDGFDGIHQRPVDVWISDGNNVCVAALDPVSVNRSTLRTGRSWDDKRLDARIGLTQFQRVRDADPFHDDGVVPSRQDVERRGSCDIREGTYTALIGPTERGYARTRQFRVHAPPPRISTATISVSVPAGETAESRFTMRNFSKFSSTWSAEPADLSASGWLVGAQDRALEPDGRTNGLLSFSAQDLAPGLYTTDIIVRVDDYYGTEVRIPVEMKVQATRSRAARQMAQDSELPGELNVGNYPNPFSAYTTVRIETFEPGPVSVTVYDMTGREIKALVNEYLTEGVHEFRFDADNLSSGTYIYRVVTDSSQKSETMTLVR